MKAVRSDEEARKLFEENKGLAYKVFRELHNRLRDYHEKDDFLQELFLSLYKACLAIGDPTGSSTYFTRWIYKDAYKYLERGRTSLRNTRLFYDDHELYSQKYDASEEEDAALKEARRAAVHSSLNKMESREREVIKNKLNGLNRCEIMRKLKLTQWQLKASITKAYQVVREEYGRQILTQA